MELQSDMQPAEEAGPSTSMQPVLKTFVEHKEDWEAAGSLSQKAVSRFYLVDTDGHQTLAVSGEELTDGKYSYRSVAVLENVETLDTRARRDVFTWLENIIELSQANGGVTIVEQKDEPVAEGGGRAGLDEHVVFVRYESYSGKYSNGRRWQEFYLVDRDNREHLAAQAASDAHYKYIYTPCEPFSTVFPLEEGCKNKKAVVEWMQNFLEPDAGAAPARDRNVKHPGASTSKHAMPSEQQNRAQDRLDSSLAARMKHPASASHAPRDSEQSESEKSTEGNDSDGNKSDDSAEKRRWPGPTRAAVRWLGSCKRSEAVKVADSEGDGDASDYSGFLGASGARGRQSAQGKGTRPDEHVEYDGVPMLELEWTRCRTATAHRMACQLDLIRMEMKAMFESATMHQMIMATSTEDIVKMLNPSQQRVPEPPPVAKVGYTAAGFSRCELMKEALKPHCKPLEPGSALEETAPVADELNAAVTDDGVPAVEEPAHKRARTAADERQAPSPATSAALEHVGPPALPSRPSALEGPAVSTSATCVPESKRHFPADAENDARMQHNNTNSQVPKDDVLNPLSETGVHASKGQVTGPVGEIAAPRSSTDTPVPSNLGAMMSRSGSEHAPASASPNAGGATSVGTMPQRCPDGTANQAGQALQQGTSPPGSTAQPALLVDRMRGSGGASDGEGLPSRHTCWSHAFDSSGSRVCAAAEARREDRDVARASGSDLGAVVRLRGSGSGAMGAPAEETSDEFMDAVEPSDADVENEPAASTEAPQGMNGDSGEHEPGEPLGISAANNTALVDSALGALGAIGWASPGLNRHLRVTNARLQSAVGACVQATSKKVLKRPKAPQALGKVQGTGGATALTQVGQLEEEAAEVALNFMASVERGHKVYGVHAPAVLKPLSEVLACSPEQPECPGDYAEQGIKEVEEGVQWARQQTSSDPEGLHYLRHEEKQDVLPDGRRVRRWYLVDQNGKLHLAVQSEEVQLNDGHYRYESQEPFASRNPIGSCKTREEALSWLQSFIRSSSEGPLYVSYKHKQAVLPDGCRVHRWFLVDHNHELHLAVQSQEVMERDGHYVYELQEPFASRNPIDSCKNKEQALRWLHSFIKSSSDTAAKSASTSGGPARRSTRAIQAPHAYSSNMGAELWERSDHEAADAVAEMLTSLGEPPVLKPLVIRDFLPSEKLQKGGQKAQNFNTLQAWAPTMTARQKLEVCLHHRLIGYPLPEPADLVAAAERILQRRHGLAAPWWIHMPQVIPDSISIDQQEAHLLFAHSPNTSVEFSQDDGGETCGADTSKSGTQASKQSSGGCKRKHTWDRPATNSELLTHPKLQQGTIARLCARHEQAVCRPDDGTEDGCRRNPPQGVKAAMYVPCVARGRGAAPAGASSAEPTHEGVRDPSAWRPFDVRVRGCTDWRDIRGPQNMERIQPESQQWSYWDDLVRVQQHIESERDVKADATFRRTVLWRLLHDPVARWGEVYQHDQCLCYRDHPGLPQTFTALPKVMPVSKGVCKSVFCDSPYSPAAPAKLPPTFRRWAEMCGAHFHGDLQPGAPPYDPDLDPVIQEMHAEFESMLAYMLAAKEQASDWLKLQVEVAASMRTFVSNLDALLSAHGVRLHLNSQRHHTTHVNRETHTRAVYEHPECQVAALDFLDLLKRVRTPAAPSAPSSAPSAAPPTPVH